jgi:hypothetical protein
LGTVYLRTHWFSDVVGGWLAGALVLLSMPTVLPYAERWTDQALSAVRRWYARRRGRPAPGPAVPQYTVVQPTEMPVSSSASDHSAAAVRASLDDLDEPTRVG